MFQEKKLYISALKKILSGINAILLATPIVLIIYWWIGEAHEVYGDEATHIGLVIKLYKTISTGGFFDVITFDERYPLLFYYLAGPFVKHAFDPLFGARVFSGLIWLLALMLSHQLIRRIATEKWVATAMVLLLASFAPFVEVGRFFLTEGVLIVTILAFIDAALKFLMRPSNSLLLYCLGLLGIGSLIKFNFMLYVSPVLIGGGLLLLVNSFYWGNLKTYFSQNWRVILFWFLLALPIPLYWYFYQVLISKSAASGLAGMLVTNHLVAYLSPLSIIDQVSRYFLLNYKPLLLIGIFSLIGLILSGFSISRRRVPDFCSLKTYFTDIQHPQIFAFLISVIGIFLIPITLSVIGLGQERRWHIEYIYIVLLISIVLSKIKPLAVIGLTKFLIYTVIFVLLINQWFTPSFRYIDLNFDKADWIGRPDSKPAGGVDIAREIVRDWKNRSDRGDKLSLFSFYHDHRGAHFQSVAFYLERLLPGTVITTDAGAFFNRPVRLDEVIASDYLVVRVFPEVSGMDDGETKKYLAWLKESPDFFAKYTTEVAVINGRYGVYRVLRLDHSRISCDDVYKQINLLMSTTQVHSDQVYYNGLREVIEKDAQGGYVTAKKL